MPYDFLGDLDMTKVVFLPVKKGNNNQNIVEICKDSSSTVRNKLIFQLCADIDDPCKTKYRLDSVPENSDGSRRGLTVYVHEEEAKNALAKLDEMVLSAAQENCKEWFGKASISAEELRFRYKPLLVKKEEEDTHSTKFKVKCGNYPTRLHSIKEDGTIVRNGAHLEDLLLQGGTVVPILSVFSIWFMANQFGVSMQAEEMIIKKGSSSNELSGFRSRKKRKVVEEDVEEPSGEGGVDLLEEEEE